MTELVSLAFIFGYLLFAFVHKLALYQGWFVYTPANTGDRAVTTHVYLNGDLLKYCLYADVLFGCVRVFPMNDMNHSCWTQRHELLVTYFGKVDVVVSS